MELHKGRNVGGRNHSDAGGWKNKERNNRLFGIRKDLDKELDQSAQSEAKGSGGGIMPSSKR